MPATLRNVCQKPRFTSTFPSITFSAIFLFLNVPLGPCLLWAGNGVRLTWTAPGDDFDRGQATRYELRYSAVPIGADTANWWNFALSAGFVPEPSRAGITDSLVLPDLPIDRTYYFAIKTADEVFNWSKISNFAELSPVACIDINLDRAVDILDAIYMLDLLYKDGPQVPPGVSGDIDHSGSVDILDAVFIISYCYNFGTPPDCGK